MKPLIEEKTIQIINEESILALISKIYGLDKYDIRFVESIEHGSGAYYRYHAEQPDPENEPRKIGYPTPFWCILNDLVKKGALFPGEYFIWIT